MPDYLVYLKIRVLLLTLEISSLSLLCTSAGYIQMVSPQCTSGNRSIKYVRSCRFLIVCI